LESLPDTELVWEFPHSIALLGPWQYYRGYCILVLRRHATELHLLPKDERRAYLDEMCLLARAISECFQPPKLNYELLGNQVPHLHWHLFPRYLHDAKAQRPVWLALDRAETDESERRRLQGDPGDTAATLRRTIERLVSLLPTSSR
jgi:diadenosine tetraphosphate (Ap4A) HIT family hydrolase